MVALTLVIPALWACGGSEEAPDYAQEQRAQAGAGELREVRRLPGGDEAFVSRPRSCTTTHGVMIDGAGQPTPRVLNVRSGACVIWGNRTGRDVYVHTDQALPEGPATTHTRHVSAGSVDVYGPLERLTPARAAIDEQRRAEQRFCPYNAIGLGDPSTKTPVKHPYTITPGGARGTILVAAASRRATTLPQPRSAELRGLLRLRCGAVLLEEQAAYCTETRAILITGGTPRPRRLRLRSGRSVCVYWGNQDDRAARVANQAEPRPAPRGARPFRQRIVCRSGFDIVDERGRLESRPRGKQRCTREVVADDAPRDAGTSIPPRTAAHLSSFRSSPGAPPASGSLSYTIRPGGATATVAFP